MIAKLIHLMETTKTMHSFFVMLKYYDRCSHNKKWHISPHTLQKTSHKNQNAHFLFHFVSKKLPVTIIIAKFARIYINYEKTPH